MDVEVYREDGTTVALEVTAVVTVDGAMVRMYGELTAAQTALLNTSPPHKPLNYAIQFHLVTTDTLKYTRDGGWLTVKKRIGT